MHCHQIAGALWKREAKDEDAARSRSPPLTQFARLQAAPPVTRILPLRSPADAAATASRIRSTG
jgi:hypothetical protein